MRFESSVSHTAGSIAVVTGVGQGIGALAMLTFGPPAGSEATLLPPWAFGLVWCFLYPCFALATSPLIKNRALPESRLALTVGAAALTVSFAFMPISCASQNPWVTVFMDGVAWLAFWVAGWAYLRVSKRAFQWLVPLVLWMPCTFTLSTLAALG